MEITVFAKTVFAVTVAAVVLGGALFALLRFAGRLNDAGHGKPPE